MIDQWFAERRWGFVALGSGSAFLHANDILSSTPEVGARVAGDLHHGSKGLRLLRARVLGRGD